MIFYHFTAHEHIESIKKQGLTRGMLPYSVTEASNAVWLTTDKTSDNHGLADGEMIPEAMCHRLGLPVGETYLDKRAICITIRWPLAKVTQWLPWARKRLDQKWLDTLIETGGGVRKAKTWYISFSPIPPGAFQNVEILHEKR